MTCETDAEFDALIEDEIVVDCYSEYERATGWHCYLTDRLAFPFRARCIKELSMSPLLEHEHVIVTGMADQNNCMSTMLAQIKWQDRSLAVPLAQLAHDEDSIDEDTLEAMDAWHYWVEQGYNF